jgi:hypothetical protein
MPKHKVTFLPIERQILIDEELSHHPTFMNEFNAATFLPYTDSSAFPQVAEKRYQMKWECRPERMVEGQR